nr:immunoglobulin light chain junction region [Macaca mulatta]MPO04925.1 immunoglobulin light chain junction region [Macaca mulatta]MPO05124.1 immunoglobulin light chain junction region [Macaca mulatta]MPO05167.1 immunoglobulin light chain junction region [Macaca mulatta]MPO05579.1 immunoglobulin light chain junction region [Macaca mulatta]
CGAWDSSLSVGIF